MSNVAFPADYRTVDKPRCDDVPDAMLPQSSPEADFGVAQLVPTLSGAAMTVACLEVEIHALWRDATVRDVFVWTDRLAEVSDAVRRVASLLERQLRELEDGNDLRAL
jgi:hypothetical protein